MRGDRSDGHVALASLERLAAASGELHDSVDKFTKSMTASRWPEGRAYREMFSLRRRMEIIEQISTALRELNQHGHLFRRVEARALYAEGLTMAQLASIFGVSRQRVSALLREPIDTPESAGAAEEQEKGA